MSRHVQMECNTSSLKKNERHKIKMKGAVLKGLVCGLWNSGYTLYMCRDFQGWDTCIDSALYSDCPAAVQGNPGSLITDVSIVSENCGFPFENSSRYSIVKKLKKYSFENKWPWLVFVYIALNHKNSIILCKEFTSNMAAEVLKEEMCTGWQEAADF